MQVKRISKVTFLLIGLSIFTSCDEINNAYSETFKHDEVAERDLGEIYKNAVSSSANEEHKEEGRKLNELMEDFGKLNSGQLAQLGKPQRDRLLKIVERYFEKWNNSAVPLFFQPQKLDEIQTKLYRFLNTENVQLYGSALYVEQDRVRLSAINPQNRNEVDWYWYEGETEKWRKEDPVKLSRTEMERIAQQTIPLNTIKLSTANLVFFEGLKRLTEIEGGEPPPSVTFIHYTYKNYWKMNLTGARADYTLETDKDGKSAKLEMN